MAHDQIPGGRFFRLSFLTTQPRSVLRVSAARIPDRGTPEQVRL
ncbi:hypothetical protein [Caproicibacter sp. BJN0012]